MPLAFALAVAMTATLIANAGLFLLCHLLRALSGQHARKLVSSGMNYTASCLDTWHRRVDEARRLMYRGGEPLASGQRYFQPQAETDWSPVRQFTGGIVVRCLGSRFAIALLTNEQFVAVTPPPAIVQPYPAVNSAQLAVALQGVENPPEEVSDSNQLFELEGYSTSSPEEEDFVLKYLFPSLDVAPTISTRASSSPSSLQPSRSPLLPKLRSRRRSPSFDSLYDVTDDEGKADNASMQPFVAIGQGNSLDNPCAESPLSTSSLLFASLEQGLGLSHIFFDNPHISPSSTTPFGNTPSTASFTTEASKESGASTNTPLSTRALTPSSQMARDEEWVNRLVRMESDHREDMDALLTQIIEDRALPSTDNAGDLQKQVRNLEATISKLEKEKKELRDEIEERGDLEEENERLQEEVQVLTNAMENLEKKNTDLEVEVLEQNRSIRHHMESNMDLEAETATMHSNFAAWRAKIFAENVELKLDVSELKQTTDGMENVINDLKEEVDSRDMRLRNYGIVFDRCKLEFAASQEKIQELQDIIQAIPNQDQALLNTITKKDGLIRSLRLSVKANRVCDKVLKAAYPVFANKYNDVVTDRNQMQNLGFIMAQRLAYLENYIRSNGHASPMPDREYVWGGIKALLGVNQDGTFDQDEDGQDLMSFPEKQIASNPGGWLDAELERIWNEKEEQERVETQRGLTWLDDDENTSIGVQDSSEDDEELESEADTEVFLDNLEFEIISKNSETQPLVSLGTRVLENLDNDPVNGHSALEPLPHCEDLPQEDSSPEEVKEAYGEQQNANRQQQHPGRFEMPDEDAESEDEDIKDEQIEARIHQTKTGDTQIHSQTSQEEISIQPEPAPEALVSYDSSSLTIAQPTEALFTSITNPQPYSSPPADGKTLIKFTNDISFDFSPGTATPVTFNSPSPNVSPSSKSSSPPPASTPTPSAAGPSNISTTTNPPAPTMQKTKKKNLSRKLRKQRARAATSDTGAINMSGAISDESKQITVTAPKLETNDGVSTLTAQQLKRRRRAARGRVRKAEVGAGV